MLQVPKPEAEKTPAFQDCSTSCWKWTRRNAHLFCSARSRAVSPALLGVSGSRTPAPICQRTKHGGSACVCVRRCLAGEGRVRTRILADSIHGCGSRSPSFALTGDHPMKYSPAPASTCNVPTGARVREWLRVAWRALYLRGAVEALADVTPSASQVVERRVAELVHHRQVCPCLQQR